MLNSLLISNIRARWFTPFFTLVLLFPTSIFAQTLNNLKLHSVGIAVSDVDRSLTFYQQLLGLPVLGEAGDSVFLRLGTGPQFLELAPVTTNDQARITHIGLSAIDFDPNVFIKQLQARDYEPGEVKTATNSARLERASTYWIADGVLHFVDVEGVEIQISAANYCGSSSFNCNEIKQQADGKLSLLGINHFTTFMSNAPRAVSFYQGLFDMGILSYQGPTPALSVGDGLQFLMFVGPAQEGAPQNPANLHHVSFMVEDFSVDGIFATLKDYGLTARPDGGTAAALQYYVSLRMPARGGAEGGTPEVYFTDPDGILLQVQDPTYCGGGGYLGDKC